MTDARYRVTSQTPRPTFDNGGRAVDVFDVSFELVETGDRGMVSIPQRDFSAARVHEAIQPLANEMQAVRALGG
jgi:hypothetical protein